jgi:hypothetical protein
MRPVREHLAALESENPPILARLDDAGTPQGDVRL